MKYSFDYEHYASLQELSPDDRALVTEAQSALVRAYAPFSNFRVGAAARLKSGKILHGSNQESEVFPAGMCAERVLLFHWEDRHSDDPVESFAIASNPATRECYPCGQCRQVMLDAERRQGTPIRVIMASGDSATVVDSAEKLLPFTFKL